MFTLPQLSLLQALRKAVPEGDMVEDQHTATARANAQAWGDVAPDMAKDAAKYQDNAVIGATDAARMLQTAGPVLSRLENVDGVAVPSEDTRYTGVTPVEKAALGDEVDPDDVMTGLAEAYRHCHSVDYGHLYYNPQDGTAHWTHGDGDEDDVVRDAVLRLWFASQAKMKVAQVALDGCDT